MPFRLLLGITLLLTSAVCGCAEPPPAPPLTRNLDLEALAIAVRFDAPTPVVVMNLANQYLSTARDLDGRAYFCERARAVPKRALFTALCGVFRARTARHVPLWNRVAWVEGALAQLDGAAEQDGLSRYLRGVTSAALPSRFARREQAVADLEWVLAHGTSFPPGLLRGARLALQIARGQAPADTPAFVTTFSVNAEQGFRFVPPELVELAPRVLVARGYDFADIAFVITDAGVVVIDTGTSERNARAALDALRQKTTAPIAAVLLTHAHWDHVGGVGVFAAGGAQVIAQAAFAQELARASAAPAAFRYFFGADTPTSLDVRPGRLVAERERLVIGDTQFDLLPIRGGETEDGLLIHLPKPGVTFVGDAFMPYVGAPLLAEGSVAGLLDTIAAVRTLGAPLLVHGHPPLTENFTSAVLPALEQALRGLQTDVLADLRAGLPLADSLARHLMPEALAHAPGAVLPFVLLRENVIKRLYQQNTGYWQTDGEGIETFSRREQALLVELVAEGSPDRLARATKDLLERGELALGFRLTDLGLAHHSGDETLLALRERALVGLRQKNQFNPFKFIIYSELAGATLSPP